MNDSRFDRATKYLVEGDSLIERVLKALFSREPRPTGLSNCPECPWKDICDGRLVDLTADPSNCGICGNQCPAGAVCRDGDCFITLRQK